MTETGTPATADKSPYETAHRLSISDPDTFWLEAARAVDWATSPSTAIDSSRPPFHRWFPDGELNTSYNCLDRHVEAGRGDQAAIIYDSAVTGTKETITYARLLEQVEQFVSYGRIQVT